MNRLNTQDVEISHNQFRNVFNSAFPYQALFKCSDCDARRLSKAMHKILQLSMNCSDKAKKIVIH